MLKICHPLVIAALFLLLTGCATQQPLPITHAASWQQRYATLKTIKQWQLKGAISIRYGDHANLASLTWQQLSKYQYMISLYGPLNLGAVRIVGQPHLIRLWKSNRLYAAKSPEALTQAQLGWPLPVSNLYYWVRGIPNPRLPAQMQFDNAHHLVQLVQQGWLIQYQAFVNVNGMDLPHTLILFTPKLQVKLVIKQWQI